MSTKSLSAVTNALKTASNKTLMEEVIKNSPKFASYTSVGTQDYLTKQGVEAIAKIPEAVSEFYGTLLRVAFEKLDVARAVDGFGQTGLLEYWASPNAEYQQRLSVSKVSPVTPGYRGLKDGDSIDQYVVRVPEVNERFTKLNYDLQNFITLQQYPLKTMFLEEGQQGALIAGIMEGMETGRIIQENLYVKYLINQCLNSTDHPLRDTQKLTLSSWNSDLDQVTDEEFTNFLIAVSDIFGTMFAVDNPATGMYNSAGFETRVEKDQYVMLTRTGIKNRINKKLMVGAFNPNYLNIDLDGIYDINDFGGLVPYADETFTTQLWPVFKCFGDESGYYISDADASAAVTAGKISLKQTMNEKGQAVKIGYQATSASVDISAISGMTAKASVYFKDPNEDIIAVIFQKGAFGLHRQNGYEVTPVQNFRGLYDNFWANSPNNGLYYDWYYNVIVIKKPAA